MGLFIFLQLFVAFCNSYVYPVDPDILEAVLDTTPSAILYYAEGDQLSELIRSNFLEAAERLHQYGILFGTFNCELDPEKCKNEQIRGIPDIRLNMFVHLFI